MRRSAIVLLAISAVFALGFLIGNKVSSVQAQGKPGLGFAAIPGVVGGQDAFGPYEVVKDWPKDISTLPGNEKWTWGAGQSVYAENPESHFSAVPRRTAQHQEARDQTDSRVRTEPVISDRPAALARRNRCGAARSRRKRPGSGRRAQAMEGHRWAWTPSGNIA